MGDESLTREARWFEKRTDRAVVCSLCPHRCVVPEGGQGTCRVRTNSGGSLALPWYGRISSLAVEPIEKVPLFHYYPGSRMLSAGFVGCSFRCKFCKSWQVSQSTGAETRPVSPQQLVRKALEAGSPGIAYTYSEPLIHAEYLLDAASAARAAGLRNVLVSNGYINPEPGDEVLGLMDAANIDLESFDAEVYRSETGGTLDEVTRFIEQAAARTHLEVTTLIIPSKSDDPGQVDSVARFLAGLRPTIPLHLSRYYPEYKYTFRAATPAGIQKLAEVARRHLMYVYPGRIGNEQSNTECPSCGSVLVRRTASGVNLDGLRAGACAACGANTPIVT